MGAFLRFVVVFGCLVILLFGYLVIWLSGRFYG